MAFLKRQIPKPALNLHFWMVLILLALGIILHYPQQLFGISTPSLFSFIGLSRHAIERILLLLPVCYTGFIFGMKWGLICLLAASAIMIPRVFLISEYFPDALLETIGIVVVGVLINLWIFNYKKEKVRRLQTISELDSAHQQIKLHNVNREVSERKYRELFENAYDAIWEQDLEGNITNGNYAFEILCGCNRQELIGMNVRSFMPEDSLNLAGRIKRSLFLGEPIEQPYEQRINRSDGTAAVIQMSTSLIKENDRPTGFLHIARDVTRRDRLITVLNTLEEGIAIIGHDYKIQFMNPSLIREFGDSIGEYCYRLFHGQNNPCNACIFSRAVDGPTEQKEWTSANGNTYDIVYIPFEGVDRFPCILTTFVNVTKRKQFELELIRLNDVKSELLQEKMDQLKAISQEVKKLEEEKKRFIRFLGVVAHDLKSPLSVTQSILSGISGSFYGPVTEEQKEMIERVDRRIDNLNELINDLIDIPLIETGQLNREMTELALNEIIQSSVNTYTVLAAEKGLQLALLMPSTLPKVYGSSLRLQQVFNNLLSNAIKYSDQGVILVRASQENKGVKIEVSDNGVGIPPEDLSRLFEDFFRGKNGGVAKGTGLGLSICRRIIEAHGGKIWAESPDPGTNSGSIFTFVIPQY